MSSDEESGDNSSTFTPITQSPRLLQSQSWLGRTPPATPPVTPPAHSCSRTPPTCTPPSTATQVEPMCWHEEMATQLFDAGCTLRRLEQLKQRMEQSSFFDDDDTQRVTQAVHIVENRVEALHRMLTKADFQVVRLFVTLKHRERLLEAALSDGLLKVEDDDKLFQSLVKKQVYLTRIAHDKAEEVSQ